MKSKQIFKELNSGQAIVIIAFAAIGLFAMMGLAVDGGRLLLLRRDTQNAADAAAVAASRALCAGRDPITTGMAAANANGYNNDEVADTVVINHPPNPVPSGISDTNCADCYVEVTVNGEIPPAFIGIVYQGDLLASSRTIGTCNPDINANTNESPELRAVWAKGNCPPAGVKVTGSDIEIEGGMHSNGQMTVNPSGSNTHTGKVSGATSVAEICNGGCTTSNPVHQQTKVDWSPDPSSSNSGNSNPYIGTCTASCFAEDPPPGTEIIPSDGKPYVTDPKNNYPVDFDISQFQSPNGKYYKAANAKHQYYTFTKCTGKKDFWQWVESKMTGNTLAEGIYYTTCDIDLEHTKGTKVNNITGKVTFVTTGSINVKGDGQQWTPYVVNDSGQELLLYAEEDAGCGGQPAIKFAGDTNTWTGIAFAPDGEIDISGSHNHIDGCAVGYSVHVAGSYTKITCDTGTTYNPPLPVVFLSE